MLSPKPHTTMLKRLKITLLATLTLIGGLTYSCSKQQDVVSPAIINAKISQSAYEELVNRMADNQTVKDYLHAGDSFANDYMVWLNNLRPEQRAAYKNDIESALDNGKPIVDPSHTEEEIAAHEAAQAERFAAIKVAFPDFVSLNEGDFSNVLNRVSTAIADPNQPQEMVNNPCAAGLRACNAYCDNNGGGKKCRGGCSAGYIMCVNSLQQ